MDTESKIKMTMVNAWNERTIVFRDKIVDSKVPVHVVEISHFMPMSEDTHELKLPTVWNWGYNMCLCKVQYERRDNVCYEAQHASYYNYRHIFLCAECIWKHKENIAREQQQKQMDEITKAMKDIALCLKYVVAHLDKKKLSELTITREEKAPCHLQ